eukprot:11409447-Prorocentrum_lima.AAC.1
MRPPALVPDVCGPDNAWHHSRDEASYEPGVPVVPYSKTCADDALSLRHARFSGAAEACILARGGANLRASTLA